ncbi:four helix bundle protein [Aquimarina sp. MMG016]|uniref:four helix bundle protein n=1 Tax=Aquimarina sp. MMG016 TaxID=2822690 RepID=UPI001B39F89B|nr:four helix bundle protein [Aquimarina sp. MMG016]MBQ4821056.1 four helix bundle protein [Aquimarina sp. MMG016]
MHLFSFEKLNSCKESIMLVKLIYKVSDDFPSEEKFGLVSQLRRASISISSNLAEGTSRSTNKDKAHFTTIAYSSLMEVLNQVIIAKELDFIDKAKYLEIRKQIEKLSNMLNALRNFQLKD